MLGRAAFWGDLAAVQKYVAKGANVDARNDEIPYHVRPSSLARYALPLVRFLFPLFSMRPSDIQCF